MPWPSIGCRASCAHGHRCCMHLMEYARGRIPCGIAWCFVLPIQARDSRGSTPASATDGVTYPRSPCTRQPSCWEKCKLFHLLHFVSIMYVITSSLSSRLLQFVTKQFVNSHSLLIIHQPVIDTVDSSAPTLNRYFFDLFQS